MILGDKQCVCCTLWAEVDIIAAQITVSALVALVVVALTHIFTTRRELEARRSEQRISYLVTAYRALAKSNNHPRLVDVADELEQAVSDIQLFGTLEQARLARVFGEELAKTQSANLDPLLNELRNSLRDELGLPAISDRVLWLRVDRKNR